MGGITHPPVREEENMTMPLSDSYDYQPFQNLKLWYKSHFTIFNQFCDIPCKIYYYVLISLKIDDKFTKTEKEFRIWVNYRKRKQIWIFWKRK
jgi:hypothetical protein